MKFYIILLTTIFLSLPTFAKTLSINCSDGFYSFKIINFDGISGEILTSGNYGDITTELLEKAEDQPYKNFTVYTDVNNRKISIGNWVYDLDSRDKAVVYLNEIKYNCSIK